MFHKTYYNQTSFLDLLFNTLVGFVFLFVIAFLLINPITEKSNVRSNAEFIINMTWNKLDKNDVDIWLEDPVGNLLWFKAKDVGLMHLDRDDLGNDSDKVTLPDGSIISYDYNQEIVTIRGFIPGEWTLNIHFYMRKDNKNPNVSIEFSKLNPSVKLLLSKKITLIEEWKEETVARFTMTRQGDIVNWNTLPKNLVITEKHSHIHNPNIGGL